MFGEDVRELGTGEVLDAVESWHAEQLDREMRIFVAAAHFADLHHPDSRRADANRADGGRMLAGMERGVSLGGPGTPLVLEFAAAELGPHRQKPVRREGAGRRRAGHPAPAPPVVGAGVRR